MKDNTQLSPFRYNTTQLLPFSEERNIINSKSKQLSLFITTNLNFKNEISLKGKYIINYKHEMPLGGF